MSVGSLFLDLVLIFRSYIFCQLFSLIVLFDLSFKITHFKVSTETTNCTSVNKHEVYNLRIDYLFNFLLLVSKKKQTLSIKH